MAMLPARRLAHLVAVLLVALVLAGCGAEAGATASTGSTERADLGFTATTLDGATLDGPSLAGTPTVLWFWAPWCPTCRAQAPAVSELGAAYAGRVDVVGVGGFDDVAIIEDVASGIDDVTHVVDDDGAVFRHFGVTAQSTYTVIDADGGLVHQGYLDDGALADLVERLAA